jgi:hypothetical protein
MQPAAREVLAALAPVASRWGRWSRAIDVDLDGTAVPVIQVEDLIIGKILAGRPKDIEDFGNLWHLHGATADRDRISMVLTMLEEALGQSDLVPAFEAVVDRRPS